MKKNLLTTLFAGTLLLVTSQLLAQTEEFVIEVIVDTEKINEKNIYEEGIITLKDKNGEATGRAIKGFRSEFKAGTQLKWMGVPKDGSGTVTVEKIERKWWPFTRNLIKALPERKQELIAETIDRKGNQRYCIVLTVNGKERIIDPKLRARVRNNG